MSLKTLFEETIETSESDNGYRAGFVYNKVIDNPNIVVTFDGIAYECVGISSESMMVYGGYSSEGPDFTNYPFVIGSDAHMLLGDLERNTIWTETEGIHTVKVEIPEENNDAEVSYGSAEIDNILENGKSVNAALMRLVAALGGEPELSDSNANLIDKIAGLVGQNSDDIEPKA